MIDSRRCCRSRFASSIAASSAALWGFGAVVGLGAHLPQAAFAKSDTDIVPRGDVAYDLMARLAADGKIYGKTRADFFRGDRLYTRGEMARLIADILPDGLSRGQSLALSVLVRKFHPELRLIDARIMAGMKGGEFGGDGLGMGASGYIPVEHGGRIVGERNAYTEPIPPPKETVFTLDVQAKGRLLTDPAAGEIIGRGAAVVPIGRDGYAAALASNFRDEWNDDRYTDFGADAGRTPGYPVVENATLYVTGRALNVTAGVMPIRWGPGYGGALLFSDEAASIPMVQVDKGFRLPGWLGRQVGRLHFTQFLGVFKEADVPTAPPNARGTKRYVAGRRIETEGSSPLSLSFSEAFKAARLPDPWASAILPFYTYQNDWTTSNGKRWFGFLASDPEPNTFWLNYVADIQAVYRIPGEDGSSRATLYADLLLDDVKAPGGLGQGDSVPRKIGTQFGIFLPNLSGQGRVAGRLEYTSIDAETYTNISAPVAWSRDNLPLGYPAGPNARTLFGRIDATLTPKINLAVEAATRRRAKDGPEPTANRLGVYATYAVDNNAFIGARLEHQRVTPPNAAARDSQTRVEVNWGMGF